MLFELTLEYADKRVEKTIVHAEKGEHITIHPQRDNIVSSGCKRFKYEVPKHNILPVAIVKFLHTTKILPAGIECHPETTLGDIVEISTKEQIEKTQIELPKKEEKRTWKFESASGGGTYIVTETKPGVFKCQCPGVWRAKDRKCKHIKEVEKY